MLALTNEIISAIRENLRLAGSDCQVCAGFDAVPLHRKQQVFLVVSPAQVTLSCAFTDGVKALSPFTADFTVSLVVPMDTPGESVLDLFFSLVLPGMQETGCMLHAVQTGQPVADGKLQRLVYSGTFRLKGLYVPDVPAEAERGESV